jgi:hypothetical protein
VGHGLGHGVPHERIAVYVPTNQMATELGYTLKLHGIDSMEISSDGPNGSTRMFRFRGWRTSG